MSRVFLLFSIACSLGYCSYAFARNALPEYTLKAAYLYNFAVLTEWPSGALGDSFDICFYGNEDFGQALDVIRNKQINNRHINIRHLNKPAAAKNCNVLFIDGIERSKMSRIMSEISSRPILTVTDNKDVAKAGATIFIRPENHRLVFEIDTHAAKKVNLNISARLLRLANEVTQ